MLRSFAAALLDCTTCMARAVELTDLNSTSRGEARVFSIGPQDTRQHTFGFSLVGPWPDPTSHSAGPGYHRHLKSRQENARWYNAFRFLLTALEAWKTLLSAILAGF